MRIRMLILAGVLAVPGLALADSYGATGAGGSDKSQDSLNQPSEMNDNTMNDNTGMQQGSGVRTGMEAGAPQVDVFKNKDNFKVKGTVASVNPTANTMTLQRENLPPVELQIASGTDIKWEGRNATLSDLQPGSEVRAEFNVAENQPVAVKVDAKPSKTQKKSQKEMQKGTNEMNKSQQGTTGGSTTGGTNK